MKRSIVQNDSLGLRKNKVLSGIDEEKSVLVFYKKEPWIAFQTYM